MAGIFPRDKFFPLFLHQLFFKSKLQQVFFLIFSLNQKNLNESNTLNEKSQISI